MASAEERCLVSMQAFALGIFDFGSGPELKAQGTELIMPPGGSSTDIPPGMSKEALPRRYQAVPIATHS